MKQMIKRKDGSTSQRGLWDNIRAAKGSGKKPTAQMLKQEKKIKAKSVKKYQTGGNVDSLFNTLKKTIPKKPVIPSDGKVMTPEEIKSRTKRTNTYPKPNVEGQVKTYNTNFLNYCL